MELTALALFAFITSITPGPNNLMLATSGLQFGFKRTIPHALGVSTGFVSLIVVCALGFGAALLAIPGSKHVMAALASVYLIVLLWRMNLPEIATNSIDESGSVSVTRATARPLAWWQSASFQYANPKAWMMAIMGVALFLPTPQWGWWHLAILCAMFFCINLVTVSVWIIFGTALRKTLANPCARAWSYTLLVGLTLYTIAGFWLW